MVRSHYEYPTSILRLAYDQVHLPCACHLTLLCGLLLLALLLDLSIIALTRARGRDNNRAKLMFALSAKHL